MASRKSAVWAVLLPLVLLVSGFLSSCTCDGVKGKDGLRGQWKLSYSYYYGSSSRVWQATDIIIVFDGKSKYEERHDENLNNYGNYKVDFSKDPAWIDIMPKKGLVFAGFPVAPFGKGIIRRLNDNAIEMGFWYVPDVIMGDERPATFEYKGPGQGLTPSLFISLTKLK